jgi:site-specific DNA-cytosine methylase
MPFASGYTGQNGAGKAAVYCKFRDLRAAESNPILREHIQRTSHGVQVDSDVIAYLSDTKGQLKYCSMYFSPHCTPHSAANNSAKGTGDEDLGQTFEDTATILEHHQPSVGIIECVPGVANRRNGRPSAIDLFKLKAPHYHVVPCLINAADIISPVTGEQAAMTHERCITYAFHKADYPKAPTLSALKVKAPRLASFAQHLDNDTEGECYQVMPIDDRRDLVYEWRKSNTGIAYVARIRDPATGRGHTSFVNDVVSPELGIAPTATAAAGSTWIQASLNGVATIRKETNQELARRQLVRGFSSTQDRALLAAKSEIGQSLLGNMLPQNSNDMILAQAAICLSQVQADQV